MLRLILFMVIIIASCFIVDEKVCHLVHLLGMFSVQRLFQKGFLTFSKDLNPDANVFICPFCTVVTVMDLQWRVVFDMYILQ